MEYRTVRRRGDFGHEWNEVKCAEAAGDAVEWAREKLGFVADERQAEVLRSGAKRGLLCCSRQWGKSTVTAVRALWKAMGEAETEVLVVSPTERQSAEFVRKARAFLPALGVKARGDGMNPHSLKLPNGSRIVALPGTERTVRGYSRVGLLVVDEAARVEDETYKAVRPMLAVGEGELWLMSTPFGQRGFFYEAWAQGGEGWARFQGRGEECPRIAKWFLEEERRALGERWYRQEYECEFVSGVRQMFDRAVVDGMWTDEARALFPGGGW